MSELRQRQSYHNQLKKLLQAAQDHDTTPLTMSRVMSSSQRATDIMDKLEQVQAALLGQCKDNDAAQIQEDAFEPILNTYLELKSTLLDIQEALTQPSTSSGSTSSSSSSSSHLSTLKLPRIDLPTFDGQYEDWPSFEDLFTATIHKNTSLSGSQKLQYLKSCVKGEAATIIKSFTTTDGNYAEAFTLLTNRYSNKREIVTSLIRKIINQTPLKQESATDLQCLLNTTVESVRSLKVLGRPTDKWDDLLSFIIIEKLDPDTKAEWAKSLHGVDPPTFIETEEFLQRHIRCLFARGTVTTKVTNPNNGKQVSSQRNSARTHHASTSSGSSSTTSVCSLCKGSHQLYQCSKLHNMPAPDRMSAVKQTTACLNCLRDGHTIKNCNSKNVCKHCSRKHHSILHSSSPSNQQSSKQQSSNQVSIQQSSSDSKANSSNQVQDNKSSNVSSLQASASPQVLLKTAIVNVTDKFGVKHPCRVLLDDGSEASFMREACAQKLGLKRIKADIIITGISATEAARVRWKVTATLGSRFQSATVPVEALLLPKVTSILPREPCTTVPWAHLEGIQLADPHYNQPGEIDILLGADVIGSIMQDGIRHGPTSSPTAQNTIFGWVLSGKVSPMSQTIIQTNHATCKLEAIIQRFWEVEEVPNRRPTTREEAACEQHFVETHQRLPDGRYQVRLPFNKKVKEIGETRQLAQQRLFQLEKRFKRNPIQHAAYVEFMREYSRLGHMELVTETSTSHVPSYYIPHHYVTKEDSSTTKLRVVFDASMKSSSGVSLNDALMVGPTIQDDLFTQINAFRLNPIGLKADIAKMYRQFEVHPEDRTFQRILWREDPTKPVREYILKTVTYGTACAPFLATRCLQQLAKDEGHQYPSAAHSLENRMYVDDLLGGEQSTSSATQQVRDLIQLVKLGGMDIRKWCTNDPAVLSSIPEDLRETASSFSFDEHPTIKALGIIWQPKDDVFKFIINPFPARKSMKKRELLSEIAKTFDPMGWLSPITINAKLLFQDLWRAEKKGWDDEISQGLLQKWNAYQKQLQQLSQLQIPRCIISANVRECQLHGFSDSSEKAYAAAVYLRITREDGSVAVNLIASRTKLAPLQQISLPKLELCGALHLADLIHSVKKAYSFNFSVFAWTDSMITLQWIQAESRRWKTFVANRVAMIQDMVPHQHWRHVRSKDNPADLPSRGITAEEILTSSLWWHGPQWLHDSSFPHSSGVYDTIAVELEERKQQQASHVTHTKYSLLDKLLTFSTYNKIISTMGWLKRFSRYLRNKSEFPKGPLTPLERLQAGNQVVLLVQQQAYPEDIKSLQKTGCVSESSKIKKLTPFLDQHGLLKVGGRLENAPVPDGKKFPILIPHSHLFTTCLIRHYHLCKLHAGPTATLSSIRRRFWIVNGNDSVRQVTDKCITCKKLNARQAKQLMGSLPTGRVTPHRPFLHCGVDFAGPFAVRMKRGRGCKAEKVYMCIFVCFSTKAVHLEAVTDLSSEAFIACYRRFVGRRGITSHMYSDCGTNFVGADRQLKMMFAEQSSRIQQQLSILGTTWHFNPPAAPHQGGLWEAGVKSVKHHLRRVMGEKVLTLEQFQTLLCNIEACLNSRPLCPLSSDPLALDVLTPGHFLIGQPLTSVPEPDLTMENWNRLAYWSEAQKLTQHFWNRWKEEYISTLQQRNKWFKKQPNMQVGDLVVIRDELTPPTRWRLGRVIKTLPGQNGLVRKVVLKTASGELIRPIAKLSIILSNDEANKQH